MVSIVLLMSWVRELLNTQEDEGGPCLDGLERLLARFDLGDPSELTAEMLRTALGEGGSRWEEGYVTWGDYCWFLFEALGGEDEDHPGGMAYPIAICPLGTERDVLFQHYTVEVVEDESPEAEAACLL